MAALMALQKIELVPPKLARTANVVAVAATVYSLYALYSSGAQAMLYGGIVTFAGWMRYGLVAGQGPGRDTGLSSRETLAPPSGGHRPRQTPGSTCERGRSVAVGSRRGAKPTGGDRVVHRVCGRVVRCLGRDLEGFASGRDRERLGPGVAG